VEAETLIQQESVPLIEQPSSRWPSRPMDIRACSPGGSANLMARLVRPEPSA